MLLPVVLPRRAPVVRIAEKYLGPWAGEIATVTIYCDGEYHVYRLRLKRYIAGSVVLVDYSKLREACLNKHIMVGVSNRKIRDIHTRPRISYYARVLTGVGKNKKSKSYYVPVLARRFVEMTRLVGARCDHAIVRVVDPDSGVEYTNPMWVTDFWNKRSIVYREFTTPLQGMVWVEVSCKVV